jgi:hypothetical protein
MNIMKLSVVSLLVAVPFIAFAASNSGKGSSSSNSGSSSTSSSHGNDEHDEDEDEHGAYGDDKVKLCFHGQTIKVAPRDVQFYLTQGATRGKCKPAPTPFTLATPVVVCKDKIPQVSLAWSTSVNAEEYVIQRIVGTTFPAIFNKAIDDTENTSFKDTKFEKDYGRVSHTYRIIAKRDEMQTASNPITVVLPECATTQKKR